MEFDEDTDDHDLKEGPMSPSTRHNRLTRFLNNLGLRPNDPPYDLNENQYSGGGISGSIPPASASNMTFSIATLASNLNPEADSFAYMETLLESLAVLGKLGTSLDTVAQRLPGEIYALVETTLTEVEERAEFSRRRSLSINGMLEASEGAYLFVSGPPMPAMPVSTSRWPLLKSSSLRLTALESLAKRVEHEILRDFFWTLYSKLDAVAQGLRVVTEVATRIGSVRRFLRSLMSIHPFRRDVITRILQARSQARYSPCRRSGITFRQRCVRIVFQ